MSFALIAAIDEKWGIGFEGDLIWNIPSDLKHFRSTTNNSCVIMGRKTYESLPDSSRPLPNRTNIVLTRNPQYKKKLPDEVYSHHSLDIALGIAETEKIHTNGIFVIGGAMIYAEAIKHPDCKKLYITRILEKSDKCDAYFPVIDPYIWEEVYKDPEIFEENGYKFYFQEYVRRT